MDQSIRQTVHKIVDLLVNRGIDHALVGGLAASLRGRPRATEDVDLILDCDVNDAESFLRSLDSDKWAPFVSDALQIMRTCFILPLEDLSSGIRLDLAIGVSGFEKQIVGRASVIEIDGKPVLVATSEDLLLMKILAARPQDDQDVRNILSSSRITFDWSYCLETADQLGKALGMDLHEKVVRLKKDHQAK